MLDIYEFLGAFLVAVLAIAVVLAMAKKSHSAGS